MLSESACMASAAEARFRIDAPNSKPRAVKVIALDRPSEAAIKQLSGPQWSNATFLTASSEGMGIAALHPSYADVTAPC